MDKSTMLLDEVLKSPVVKRAIEAGEEQVGRVVGKLLASDRVTTGLQALVSSAMHARETLERGMGQALHAANLPSREDVATLKQKLDDLESMIDGLSERVSRGGDRGRSSE